jgi:hypothetical protein
MAEDYPKSVTVGGHEYAIVYRKLKGDVGRYYYDKKEIHIRKGMDPKDTRDTIRHELVHIVMEYSGLSYVLDDEKVEEAIARVLDNILFPALDAMGAEDAGWP